ncbi:MAG TPA: twin-arginine translocase subunit TatC [Gemmatimonadales bacterium]|nr:twin-arginine translocase subunit TatC [Gemmatimonadales bacterium]
MKKRDDRAEMPFLEHLEELRWRLIRALGAVLVGCVVGYFLATRLDVIGFMTQPIRPYLPPGQKLFFTTPIEPFFITLKLAFVMGLLIATPVVVWQGWGFLRPALYEHERRVVIPVGFIGVALFLVGAAIAFYVVMPLAIRVIWGFQSQSLAPMITADAYFSFTTTVVLSFGAVFELPLVLLMLVYLRVISADFLRRHRRIALILNAVLSAVLTPGDLVLMTVVVMVPVQLFYELSIVLATIIERRRAKESAAAAGSQAPGPGAPAPGKA